MIARGRAESITRATRGAGLARSIGTYAPPAVEHRVHADDRRRRLGHHERDPVAGPDPAIAQQPGEPAAFADQLSVAEPLVAEHDGGGAGVSRRRGGGVLVQERRSRRLRPGALEGDAGVLDLLAARAGCRG